MCTMILKFIVVLTLVSSFENIAAGGGGGGNGNNGGGGGGGGSSGGGSGGSSGGGSGGDSSGGGGSKVKVTISFDSLNSKSIDFMKGQVKQAFDQLKDCVEWDFVPCSTSHIVDDVLQCEVGVMECKIDALHACASHYYEKEPDKAGKFFICMMSSGNQVAQGEKCAGEAGMDWNKLKGCKPCNEAGTYCDNRWKKLNMLHEPRIPGVIFDWKYDACVESSAMNDLKGTICQQIKKQGKQCPACDGCGGGGSGGPGGQGGGSGSPGGQGGGSGSPGGHGGGSGSPGGHGGGSGSPGGQGSGHHGGPGGQGGGNDGNGGSGCPGGDNNEVVFQPDPVVGAGIVDPPGVFHCV